MQIALSPDGSSAYVTNYTSGSVSQFDVTAAGALSPKKPAAVAAGPTGGGHRRQPGWRQRLRDQPGARRHRCAVLGRRGERRPDPEGARPWTPGLGRAPSSRPPIASTWPTSAGNTVSQYTADGGGALSRARRRRRHQSQPVRPRALARRPQPLRRLLHRRRVGQYDVAGDGTLAAKAGPPVPAGSRPQAVVAVLPRDEQAPTIDLRTPAGGRAVRPGRRRARGLLVRRRGRLGPRRRARATWPTATRWTPRRRAPTPSRSSRVTARATRRR